MASYTTIIGLEVHVQLATKSKLFCRCSTQFGAEPNTQTCPVCIGMPGSLPVMNTEALNLSLKTAVALNCTIPPLTKWDRKQYYYPDLPKGYQISQYDMPMSEHGYLEISDSKDRFQTKQIRILRAHLEEDAGKSVHDEVAGKADSVIDLNRTGTPLLEIVSEPDMRSGLEARAYLDELKLLLTYIGVSDCNMQEGSLRVDANVNLHLEKGGEKIATPIVEIKNMNSFRAVERAIEYEAGRQYGVWQETGAKLGDSPKQTRGWDDAAGVTRGQRSKEESSDYRYFPDPDLVPVMFSDEQVSSAKASLGELPSTIRAGLQSEHGLSAYDAEVLVNQGRTLMDYYHEAVKVAGDAKGVCNWVTQDVLRVLKESESGIETFSISAVALGDFVAKQKSGELPTARGRDVFDAMLENGISAADAMQSLGIEEVDDSELESLCQTLLDANPRIVEDVKGGKQQAVGALIGQAKKQNPNADPSKVRQICLELIAKM
ncbi:Asp-tRNA(Asn)/Glu-tRNA(Gln) amidotransferase subunit GatB [Aeoliella sp.]|uniref:Asp-tRNA(Asn)/Glu-tRNA(Gln) amidotransferase subunit GatB n=1 Tax=Aeoliella sp. TaxID=2795800 RepID=UPI003CCBE07B